MKWIALAGALLVLGAVAVAGLLVAARDSPNPGATAPPPGPYRGSRLPAGLHAPDFTLRSY
ncbi:MAG TPA: hypothetical protein VGJ70_04470 [Solirubrobacteraceae bacterium]